MVNISGFTIQNASVGIYISDSYANISYNIIQYCKKGIKIKRLTQNNKISSNDISENNYGICIEGQMGLSPESRDNFFINNNFIGNQKNAEIGLMSHNTLDNNYWDDWIGLKFRLLRFFPYTIYTRGNPLISILHNIDWSPAKEPNDIDIGD